MNKNSLIITVVAVIIVGAGAFFGGMKYQQTKVSAAGGQFQAGRFGGNARFGRAAGGGAPTAGKIVASDSSSITISLPDGSSKIVNISASTKIVKSSTATSADLTKDTEVAIFGTTNSDGSITAMQVQINPMNMFRARPTAQPTQ